MAKLLGYRYCIHEMYPVENGDGISKPILWFDTLSATQEVLDVIQKHDLNFTVYIIVAQPVRSKTK